MDMEDYILQNLELVRMEGFPVERDCDILIRNLLEKDPTHGLAVEDGTIHQNQKKYPLSTGDSNNMEFDDSFDDLDENLLRNLPLDFPFDDEEPEKVPTDTDSGIGSHDVDHSPLAEAAVDVPDQFLFPFPPYDIQVGFMRSLYRCLDQGKIGIFESPTGTGKSLSLICGALTWLRDYEERQKQELEQLLQQQQQQQQTTTKIKTEPRNEIVHPEDDWITAFAKKKEEDEVSKKLQEEREQRLKREEKLKQLRNNLKPNPRFKRKREKLEDTFTDLFKDAPADLKDKLSKDLENCENKQSVEDNSDGADDHIVLEEYHSEDEVTKNSSDDEDDKDDDAVYVTKIYFCSRTHSQLAQFVREVQKSPFGEDTSVVTLGSRQNLCINDAVKRLKSLSLINDRCKELQKNKSEPKKKKDGEAAAKRKKTTGGCPFYKQANLTDFRDRVLVDVKDIEQLVSLGRHTKGCPYYGTRHSLPMAQLVALPYNLLLHKSTRDACGIKLKDNIVIIDEAHNLIETVNNIHSIELTGAQVMCAHSQLSQYSERYRSRLKAKNLMYIKQILFILSAFIKCLGGKPGIPADKQHIKKSETRLQTINDFLFATQLDNLNLFKIMKYCERSFISKKLHGFVEKYQPSMVHTVEEKKKEPPTWALSKFLQEISQARDNASTQDSPKKDKLESADSEEAYASMSSPLMHIEGFLEALTNANKDGRIVITKEELLSKSRLKFLLLNPAVHFSELLSEARAVIVAGGTMQPLSDFKDQLFFAGGVSPERILEFSCGHVIPKENLLPLALARGSSGQELDFTYQNRDQPEMMDELGRVVYNVCNIVPGGIVVFFPSYEYERVVYKHWDQGGFLKKICAKKKVFREPKKACYVDQVLSEYTTCIRKSMNNKYAPHNGAILFCVVGGKMSEGINFSDDLGRCVIMVGLPYPNLRSPELKEKMEYLNANMQRLPDGKLPGQLHYENLCMKAVNQSIGRAIRHRADYSSILLLDHRYLRPSMRAKLPSWIGDHLVCMDRFGPAFASLRKFFTEMKKSSSDDS